LTACRLAGYGRAHPCGLADYGRAHPKKNKKILVKVASVEGG